MIKIALVGANGRMGLWVQKLVQTEFPQVELVCIQKGSAGKPKLDNLTEVEVIIDFASAEAGFAIAKGLNQKSRNSQKKLPALIVGSTGWSTTQRKALSKYAENGLVLEASNFSEGLYLMSQILKNAGPALRKLGYQPQVREIHHIHKKDSPSGTALTLQDVVQSSSKISTPIQSIRAGEVIGDHEVLLFGKADRIVISHSAQDRSIFARGAIRVAVWLAEIRKKSKNRTGFLGMSDYYESILEQRS